MTPKLPHLNRAAKFLAGKLPDQCTIVRPGVGEPVTSDEPPYDTVYPDDMTVHSGPCYVNESMQMAPTDEIAGQSGHTDTHWARLPGDVPQILHGDILRVTATERDQWLVGKEFDVVDPRVATHMVSRRVGLRIRERSPRSH